LGLDQAQCYHQMLWQGLRTEQFFDMMMFSDLVAPADRQQLRRVARFGQLYPAAPFCRSLWVPHDLAAYRRSMQQIRLLLSFPYYDYRSDVNQITKLAWSAKQNPLTPVTALVISAVSYAYKAAARADAYRRAALVGIAAYRYAVRHGHAPKRLEELVPEFLATPPRDPFDGNYIRLVQIEQRLVAYSIGPDLKDDDGRISSYATRDERGDLLFAVPIP